jgi:hypothetical protein
MALMEIDGYIKYKNNLNSKIAVTTNGINLPAINCFIKLSTYISAFSPIVVQASVPLSIASQLVYTCAAL